MNKCKHKNGYLSEIIPCDGTHEVKDGKVTFLDNVSGYTTGYVFHCYDCDKKFHYTTHATKPKWLTELIDQI